VVLLSVGRSLYVLGMSLLVVFFVLIALIGALSPLGVSLPAELTPPCSRPSASYRSSPA
jgi:hypothetical protein